MTLCCLSYVSHCLLCIAHCLSCASRVCLCMCVSLCLSCIAHYLSCVSCVLHCGSRIVHCMSMCISHCPSYAPLSVSYWYIKRLSGHSLMRSNVPTGDRRQRSLVRVLLPVCDLPWTVLSHQLGPGRGLSLV